MSQNPVAPVLSHDPCPAIVVTTAGTQYIIVIYNYCIHARPSYVLSV